MTKEKFSTDESGSRFQELKRLWVKAAVEASGRKQSEIAAVMEISPANLSALVNGHKPITDATMDKVAMALNLALPGLGVKTELPTPPVPGVSITKEMWEEVVLNGKTVTRLLHSLLDQRKK